MSTVIDGSAGITTNAGGSVNPSTNIDGINYSCRAWVNFNGTGTVAIYASGNVTSITDNGAGAYTVNLTTSMSDINYAVITTMGGTTTAGAPISVSAHLSASNTAVAPTVSAFRLLGMSQFNNTAYDATYINVAVFR